MKHQAHPKPELLAPAGNFEKLEIAVHFGADAVYLAGKDFSLRNFSGNFTMDEIQQAIAFAHANKVKVYVACNIFPRNHEQAAIAEFLTSLEKMDPDAIIISDPGILAMARELMPQTPIHLSTQANTTNYNAARFWESQGVKRVNVARELTLPEIKTIAENTTLEIEAFVHGAMCISYSGRCLLSSFMENRDGNRGMCCQPCRFSYTVCEEKRPGQYYPIAEDKRGSYIFNSRDLCMIEHIPGMIDSGITSLKIEGRMKGINYLASTVKVYREAVDSYMDDPQAYTVKKWWIEELGKISNRGYGTGFYLGNADHIRPNYFENITDGFRFVAKVEEEIGSRHARVEVRNKIYSHDEIEIIKKKGPNLIDRIIEIKDLHNQPVPFAQPGSSVIIELNNRCTPNDLIRKIQP
jgi:putative protease